MATKPLIVVLEPDSVFRDTVRDALGLRYGDRFEVVASRDTKELERSVATVASDVPIAMLLVAHDAKFPCADAIRAAGPLAPYAKRLSMVVADDVEAPTEALRRHQIDGFAVKPMTPFERYLFPLADEQLEDWLAAHRPLAEEVAVYGFRWCPKTFAIKDFLSSHEIPYRWEDLRAPLPTTVEGFVDRSRCEPVVRLPHGELLVAPDLPLLASRLGLDHAPKREFYDVIILGAGPAGLAAAVYGASEGLRLAVVESHNAGGQAGTSSLIENYLGFPAGLTGSDLTRRAVLQARKFGAEILSLQPPQRITFGSAFQQVRLQRGREISCHALVLATGVQYRLLEVPDVERFNGAGVYYGSVMSEAPSCTGEDVVVVGGGNSAGQAALHLSKFAHRVAILTRDASLSETMSKYLVDEIGVNPRINVRPLVSVVGLAGEIHLQEVILANVQTHQTETIRTQSLFVFIGATPRTVCVEDRLALDPQGYILTGRDLPEGRQAASGATTSRPTREAFHLETSVPGVFAIGDVRHGSVKRVSSAVGDGATVVQFIHKYLSLR